MMTPGDQTAKSTSQFFSSDDHDVNESESESDSGTDSSPVSHCFGT